MLAGTSAIDGIGWLVAIGCPTGVFRGRKLLEPPALDRAPSVGHQALVVRDVVEREQDRPEHFLGHEEMPKIAPASATGGAGAVFVEGAIIELMLQIAQPQSSFVGEGQRVPTVPCGHDAVKHIDASADAFEKIFRTPDSHQVPGLVLGHGGNGGVERLVHFFGRFAHAEPADGVAREFKFGQAFGAFDTHLGIESALNDGELRLVVTRGGVTAASSPADRAFHGVADDIIRMRQPDDMIKDHGDVASEVLLDSNRVFRRQMELVAVDVRAKDSTLLIDLGPLREAEELEAPAISKNGPVPSHEGVKTAKGGDNLVAWAEGQMVGVGENDATAGRVKLLDFKSLDRRCRADRHKCRSLEGAMCSKKRTGARIALAVARV